MAKKDYTIQITLDPKSKEAGMVEKLKGDLTEKTKSGAMMKLLKFHNNMLEKNQNYKESFDILKEMNK